MIGSATLATMGPCPSGPTYSTGRSVACTPAGGSGLGGLFGGSFAGSLNWERGQHIGSETVHVIAWLGPHHTGGGADESGYKFSWAELREPIIDAVTGAGWTYKPKKV